MVFVVWWVCVLVVCEAKAIGNWMLEVVFEENLVSEIGRACLIELGCK